MSVKLKVYFDIFINVLLGALLFLGLVELDMQDDFYWIGLVAICVVIYLKLVRDLESYGYDEDAPYWSIFVLLVSLAFFVVECWTLFHGLLVFMELLSKDGGIAWSLGISSVIGFVVLIAVIVLSFCFLRFSFLYVKNDCEIFDNRDIPEMLAESIFMECNLF